MSESSSLLKVDLDEAAKRPPLTPVGDYPAIIKQMEVGKSAQKQTPYVRLTISISGFPEGIDSETRAEVGSVTGKTMYKDYWYSSINSRWDRRLPKLLKELGFSGDMELALNRVVGSRVLACIKHRLVTEDKNKQPLDEPFTVVEIDSLIGVEA